MRHINGFAMLATVVLLRSAAVAVAQTPANDLSARLREVLPADVAARVLAVIAKARSRDLPADALENRALKFAAKGVNPEAIEKSVVEQEERMGRARDALQKGNGRKAAGDEIEAAAEAMRKGLDAAKVSELAQSAPSGRSLAVPLYVVGSMVDRGLPSDDALQRVEQKLKARATDQDLERMPGELPAQAAGRGNRPAETGRELAGTKKPGSAAGAGQGGGSQGGPPAGVPANGGRGNKPAIPPGQVGKPPKKP